MSWFDGIVDIFSGDNIGSSLLRTVAIGYALNKVTASANKENNKSGSTITSANAPGIDNGVRLQVPPAADQKIPVLYGTANFGGIISEAVMSNYNQRMHYVLTLAEKTGTLYSNSAATSYTLNSVRWNDQLVYFKADGVTVDYTVDRGGNKDESLRDLVKIYFYAGSSSSANQKFPTGYSGTPVNAYSIVSGWNSGYQMNNLVFAVVEVNYSAERNIKGIGDIKFNISTNMNKPGDVIYDYFTNSIYGANIAASAIDTASLTSLNSYSATSVNYVDEGSGNLTLPQRYQINGLVNTDQPVMRNVEDLASSAGSWLRYDITTGKWGVIINKTGTSIASFDDSNILGTISVSGTGLTELYNSVKTEFPNRDIGDNTDYMTISIPAGDRNANEPNNTLNISYNFINEPVQAQLLGFIELKQSRIDLVIRFSTDYSTLGLTAGDIIDVTNSKLGFTGKLFRIISISEVQGEDALTTEITALEYDATVYDESNLTRYVRTSSNGLITSGNIGIPSTPTITKYENDARPRIVVSTTAPTGIVEGMEYWLSNDVALGDAQRSYRLIATKVSPNGNANVRGTFTTGETISLDYDTIGTSNLVIKTRAYNSTTVGPFSSNSAITTFTSRQTTDAISPTTGIYDELGGLATVYGIITLLNHLDDLIQIFSGNKGIFDTVKDILFPDAGTASNAYVILNNSNIFTSQIDSQIQAATDALANDPAFIANVGAQAANIGNYSIDAFYDVDTANVLPKVNQVLAWDGNIWRPAYTCCSSLTYPAPAPGDPGYVPPPATTYYLTKLETLPNDQSTWADPTIPADPNMAPRTGSYYIYYTGSSSNYGTNDPNKIYAALSIGTGNAKLYKSNGTLVQTLPAASAIIDKNRVELPFATREYATDYYILLDEGFVTYCQAKSPAVTDPTVWNFNTPYYDVSAYSPPAGALDSLSNPNVGATSYLTITDWGWTSNIECPTGNFMINFSEDVAPNTGTITFYEGTSNAGPVAATVAASSGTPDGTIIDYGTVANIGYGKQYHVEVPASVAVTIRPDWSHTVCGVSANIAATQHYSNAASQNFGTIGTMDLVSYDLVSRDGNGNVVTDPTYQQSSIESQLVLNFNHNVQLEAANPLNAISIYEQGGTLHQTFNLKTAFATEQTSEIVQISNNVITLNPTKDFKVGTNYYATITNNAISNGCHVYPGTANTSVITWKTVDFSAGSVSPAAGTSGPVNNSNIVMNFGESVTSGPGRVKIYDSGGNLVANLASTDSSITYY